MITTIRENQRSVAWTREDAVILGSRRSRFALQRLMYAETCDAERMLSLTCAGEERRAVASDLTRLVPRAVG